MTNNKEKVICVYDENGPSVTEKILETFDKFLKSKLQNNSFSVSNKKGNNKNENRIH